MHKREMFEETIIPMVFPKDSTNQYLYDSYFRFTWKLIKAQHQKFLTSDNPIILYSNLERPKIPKDLIKKFKQENAEGLGTIRYRGLAEKGIQLYFPISPDLCLLFYDPHENQKLLNTIQINEQILIQCYEAVVSSVNCEKIIQRFLKRKYNERKEYMKYGIEQIYEEY